jgi:fucose permease
VVYLVLAAAYGPLVVGFLVSYPRRQPAESDVPPPESPAALAELPGPRQGGGLLDAVLRERGVLLGAAFLAVYVGLEIGMGNWGFSYLVEARGLSRSLAGYSVSGYWLGLTVGRFVISPISARIGATTASMMYACLIGVVAATAGAGRAPVRRVAAACPQDQGASGRE